MKGKPAYKNCYRRISRGTIDQWLIIFFRFHRSKMECTHSVQWQLGWNTTGCKRFLKMCSPNIHKVTQGRRRVIPKGPNCYCQIFQYNISTPLSSYVLLSLYLNYKVRWSQFELAFNLFCNGVSFFLLAHLQGIKKMSLKTAKSPNSS